MLVARVLGDCPGCGGSQCFGNVLVLREYVLRGCGRCKYEAHYLLPEPQPKKVLYLDQLFFSAAFRNKLDPTKGQPEIVRLMQRIKHLASAQLLTVPRSSIHEAETRQWKLRKEALAFLKVTSRGHEFERDYKVERTQMLKGFQAWLDGADPDYKIEQREALTQRVHEWDGYLIVDAEFDRGDGSAERARKLGSAKNLVNLFDGWRASASTFKEDFDGELAGQARLYVSAHKEWFIAAVQGDVEALMYTPLMEHMRHCLPKGTELEEGVQKCIAFFKSEHFARIPLHAITCRAHATLKHDVMQGSYPVRKNALRSLQGYYTDLDHIAHYAPYCDAIAIDKAMAELVKKPGVALEETYGVKVFSLNKIDAFNEWLDGIEASMSDEHRQALQEVYG